jgi:hypothetical protein
MGGAEFGKVMSIAARAAAAPGEDAPVTTAIATENDGAALLGPAELDLLNDSMLAYIRALPADEIARRQDEVAVDGLGDDAAQARAEAILAREGVVLIRSFLDAEAIAAAEESVLELKRALAERPADRNLETATLLVQAAVREVTGYGAMSKHPKAIANVRHGADEGMVDVFNFDRLRPETAEALRRPFSDPRLLGLLDAAGALRPANLNLYLNRDITHTRGFHADSYERTQKGLCYLTDVTDLGFGPYCYVRRTHLDGPWRWANRKISELAAGPTEAPFVDPAMILPCVAPRGTLVLSDQSGVHRGLPQEPGRERQVLVMRYR